MSVTPIRRDDVFFRLTVEQRIQWLQSDGTGLSMHWEKQAGVWEVAWLTGGESYAATHASLHNALWQVYEQALTSRPA